MLDRQGFRRRQAFAPEGALINSKDVYPGLPPGAEEVSTSLAIGGQIEVGYYSLTPDP